MNGIIGYIKEFGQIQAGTPNSWFTLFTNLVSLFVVTADFSYFILDKLFHVIATSYSIDDLKWANGAMIALWAAWQTSNKFGGNAVNVPPVVQQ